MSLERDLTRLARAIDAVLIAGHAQRHWLRPDHPPFRSADAGDRGHDDTDLLAAAVRHYGGPSAALDLWSLCRAVEELSLAWTGAPPPAVVAALVPPMADSETAAKRPLLSLRIADLEGLSVRTANALITDNIITIADLLTRNERELMRTPNFGGRSRNEVRDLLARLGLALRPDVPPPAAQPEPVAPVGEPSP